MFKGSLPALITPMKNGKVDEQAFERLVEWHISEGSHGLVPVGTTGETPTLSHDEHKRVVELCIKVAKGRVPVIAGAGSNSTAEAIELTEFAKAAGASAALHSTGYYNKPTQEGLYLHFKAISDAVDLPIIVYNVPPRTVVDILPGTLARIAELKNVAGVKDASAKVDRMSQHRLLIKKPFSYLSGEDATALGFNAHGGNGCISVTEWLPRLCAEFQDATLKGDYKAGAGVAGRAMPLHDALFVETNPAGEVCRLASWFDREPECRLPLAPDGRHEKDGGCRVGSRRTSKGPGRRVSSGER
ncbi:MAG: 4-hydroxy-tetrahydrodipicolinate synthase [Hyphomicrobiaceae bacterium]